MSYLLFAQTSIANGQRNTWTGTTDGQLAGVTTGVVGGSLLVNGVANASFSEAALLAAGWAFGDTYADGQLLVAGGSRALYDLSGATALSTDASFNLKLATALTNTGNVLGVASNLTLDNTANNRTLDDMSGYRITTAGDASGLAAGMQLLDIGLADVNWNDIKNVEVRIDSADTGDGFDAVAMRSFVDARIKIGDSAGCRDATTLSPEVFSVQISDGKRGQVDGSQSDQALSVAIDVWTNDSGWQNSFSNQGSVFGDTFKISYGSLTVLQGISEFGLGAGRLVDADDTAFGTDAGQASAYNGQLTTLLTNMGAGNDLYDARMGVAVVSNGEGGTMIVAAELMTTDYVWGGSGNDVIYGGGGNDILYGDFGGAGGVVQSADPEVLHIKLGGPSDSFAQWQVIGISSIWQKNLGGPVLDATAETWENFQVTPNYGVMGTSGIGVGTHSGNGNSNQPDSINPEVNTSPTGKDVLGINFVQQLSGAKIGLQLFYQNEVGTLDESVAFKLVGAGGVEVATYRVEADGGVKFLSGVDGFTVSLVGGGDSWDGSNLGASTIHVVGKAGAPSFTSVELSSGGLVNDAGDSVATPGGETADFTVTDICVTTAVLAGNDTLFGGGGNDILSGGGDTGVIVLCGAKGAEKLVNGGFETVATDAVQKGGWYLTEGAGAAGNSGFGWLAKSTTLTFDDLALPTGDYAEAPIANGYGGFNWVEAGVFRAAPVTLGGYTAASGTQIGFIAEANGMEIGGYDAPAGSPLTFSRSTAFDLTSLKVSAAFRDDLMITAKAFNSNGAQIGSKTFEADRGVASLVDFTTGVTGTFSGAFKITLNGNDSNGGTNDYFGIDDLTFSETNIEIQKDGTGGLSAFAGQYKLELDSDPQSQANPLVEQSFSTCVGGRYTMEFAFAERQGAGNGSSDFQLFYEGALVATFTNGTSSDSWAVVDADLADGITVTTTDVGPAGGWFNAKVVGLMGDGSDSVGFKGLAAQTNTHGAFIDAVSFKSDYNNVSSATAATADVLTGGAGRDIFVYNLGDGVDVITDFNVAEDRIDIDLLANYTRSTVVYDGVLSTLVDSNLDNGAILVRGVATMADNLFF